MKAGLVAIVIIINSSYYAQAWEPWTNGWHYSSSMHLPVFQCEGERFHKCVQNTCYDHGYSEKDYVSCQNICFYDNCRN